MNAGVVTWATWANDPGPAAGRQKTVREPSRETIVFYPAKLVAGSGQEFDQLVKKYRKVNHAVDWEQELDLDGMALTTIEDIDEKYVTLRYQVGESDRPAGRTS